MKTIYKYPLEITDEQEIEIPLGSRILSVQMQRDQLCLWAMVNSKVTNKTKIKILVCGTGNPIEYPPSRMEFLGTIQQQVFVWHVFALRDE